jgi:hypothetical protein
VSASGVTKKSPPNNTRHAGPDDCTLKASSDQHIIVFGFTCSIVRYFERNVAALGVNDELGPPSSSELLRIAISTNHASQSRSALYRKLVHAPQPAAGVG